jgi:hypothetical protein
VRRPSLRSQLNQIRLWVRQGRTDAWIAHKLDISVEQLRTFKHEQGLEAGQEHAPSPPPANFDAADVAPEEDTPVPAEVDTEPPEPEPESLVPERLERERLDPEPAESHDDGEPRRRRRRGRRGGRRRAGRQAADSYEATFDHGEEGYGLWLDPAVAENDVYTEHWAGHRAVSVTVEPDAITIRRADGDSANGDGAGRDELD